MIYVRFLEDNLFQKTQAIETIIWNSSTGPIHSRPLNTLINNDICTKSSLTSFSLDELRSLKGMGDKAFSLIYEWEFGSDNFVMHGDKEQILEYYESIRKVQNDYKKMMDYMSDNGFTPVSETFFYKN